MCHKSIRVKEERAAPNLKGNLGGELSYVFFHSLTLLIGWVSGLSLPLAVGPLTREMVPLICGRCCCRDGLCLISDLNFPNYWGMTERQERYILWDNFINPLNEQTSSSKAVSHWIFKVMARKKRKYLSFRHLWLYMYFQFFLRGVWTFLRNDNASNFWRCSSSKNSNFFSQHFGPNIWILRSHFDLWWTWINTFHSFINQKLNRHQPWFTHCCKIK